MTTEEARIVVLEDALIRAHSITEFLHNCLTNKETYIYQYPEHVLKYIEYLESLITIPNLCYHSYYAPDRGQECKPCEENRERRIKLKEAKDQLNSMEAK